MFATLLGLAFTLLVVFVIVRFVQNLLAENQKERIVIHVISDSQKYHSAQMIDESDWTNGVE